MLALFDGNSTNTDYITAGQSSLPTLYTPQVPVPTQPFGCFASYNAYNLTAIEQASIVNFSWNEATQGLTFAMESEQQSSAMAWQTFQPLDALMNYYGGLTDVDVEFNLQVFQVFFHYTNSYVKMTQIVISQGLIKTLGRYNMYWAVADYRSNTQTDTISGNVAHNYRDFTFQGYTSQSALAGLQYNTIWKEETYGLTNLATNGASISYTRALKQIEPSLFGQTDFAYFKPFLMSMQEYSARSYNEPILSDYISFYVPPYEVGTYSAGYQDGKEVGEKTGWQTGYNQGFDEGKEVGYDQGLIDGENSTFVGPFTLLGQAFSSTTQLLEVEVFPHVTIGALIFIPVAVTVMIAIFKMIKR